jgi:hypothetical protein
MRRRRTIVRSTIEKRWQPTPSESSSQLVSSRGFGTLVRRDERSLNATIPDGRSHLRNPKSDYFRAGVAHTPAPARLLLLFQGPQMAPDRQSPVVLLSKGGLTAAIFTVSGCNVLPTANETTANSLLWRRP